MDLVNKLWSFCNKLRQDGVDSSDYIDQLTYLLFLKMAQEKGIYVPHGYDWQSLLNQENGNLLSHLEIILQRLKNEKGLLGDIFSDPVSRVRNTKILKSLIQEIDCIHWSSFKADVVGLAFEELIGKVAKEGKKGAGQYFTPRPLIHSIVNVIRPNPLESKDFSIGDVATGTAGFLIVACEWFKFYSRNIEISKQDSDRIINSTYFGQELVQRPRRLALMNMFLHGINAKIELGDSIYDKPRKDMFNCILTNPPFGNKGANQIPERDFPVKTSDKQLNFIQHIIEKLKTGGRAAIVLPDSCLSADAAKKIWAHYLNPKGPKKNSCNLHTILKLPEGVFAAYANGVKACVIFLQKGYYTKEIWIYDARRDLSKITTKSNALADVHFVDFEQCYGNLPNGESRRVETERFKKFKIDKIIDNNYNLSFHELSTNVSMEDPLTIIDEMITDYERKIKALKNLKGKLSQNIHAHTKTLASN